MKHTRLVLAVVQVLAAIAFLVVNSIDRDTARVFGGAYAVAILTGLAFDQMIRKGDHNGW